MAVQRKKLRVLPNPWLHIDDKGRPAGAVKVEQPGNGSFLHGWVGARVAKVTEIEPPKRVKVEGRIFEQRHGIHDLEFAHAEEPVTVNNTPYYRKKVSNGELIAFDEESAKACGISGGNFIKPETLLEKLKQDAIKQFDAENGEGAFETLADMAKEEAEIADAVAKAVAEGKGEASTAFEFVESKLAEAGLVVTPGAPLEGVTLPADGVERTVELEASPALAPLATIEPEEAGDVSAFSTSSTRSKNRKGSDQ